MYSNCHPDCIFISNEDCNDCKDCTYCGNQINQKDKKRNMDFDRIMAYASKDKTVAPTCPYCDLSKGSKDLKTWLRYIKDSYPTHWHKIKEHNNKLQNMVAQTVKEIENQ